MSSFCFTPIDRPDVQYRENADGCETALHDVELAFGGISQGNDVISIALLQLNTQRGWWGDQFLNHPLGSNLHLYANQPFTSELSARIDEAVRECLEPLIIQELIDTVEVDVVQTIDAVEISVELRKDDQLFRVTGQ